MLSCCPAWQKQQGCCNNNMLHLSQQGFITFASFLSCCISAITVKTLAVTFQCFLSCLASSFDHFVGLSCLEACHSQLALPYPTASPPHHTPPLLPSPPQTTPCQLSLVSLLPTLQFKSHSSASLHVLRFPSVTVINGPCQLILSLLAFAVAPLTKPHVVRHSGASAGRPRCCSWGSSHCSLCQICISLSLDLAGISPFRRHAERN